MNKFLFYGLLMKFLIDSKEDSE